MSSQRENVDPLSMGRWILLSLSDHRISVQEDGRVVRTISEFSTGRDGHLTPLETDVQIDPHRRFRRHVSSLYQTKGGKPAEMPFALFFDGACAFHQGDPKVESHGCVHLSAVDAEWLFNWVGQHEVHVRISGPRPDHAKPV
jgi:lipoprotein-anchoring transpeptidase ErfK/SrfK